jgi:hypothetical protein
MVIVKRDLVGTLQVRSRDSALRNLPMSIDRVMYGKGDVDESTNVSNQARPSIITNAMPKAVSYTGFYNSLHMVVC